ncbi:MAG: hypothetical protein V7L25_28200 [Nostoc sp.]|uniref:hypothetical protein n=1 Tax=Nostoc sp. TaxID=1180 RepID=UPI002FF42E21
MLNLDTIRNATVYEFPYRWAFIQNALTKEDSLQLARTYPSIDQFQEFHWEGNGFFDRKPAYCTLKDIARIQKFRKDLWKSVELGKISSSYENLNESWQKFITNLLSPAHREAIGDLLRLNLKDHITRVSFRRLCPKHFGRTPHTDFRSGTTVTQLYFFNQE